MPTCNNFHKFRSNVYNKVTVKIEENYLKELTFRELNTARFFDKIGNIWDPIETITEYDSYLDLPKEYTLDVLNSTPVNAIEGKAKYLLTSEGRGLRNIPLL
jgi:hypothetical protein